MTFAQEGRFSGPPPGAPQMDGTRTKDDVMKTIHSAALLLSATLLAASCGCSAAPTITRGQDPVTDAAVTPAGHDSAAYGGHGYQPSPIEVMMDHHQYTDYSQYEVDENGQIVTYDPHAQVTNAVPNCPTCNPAPACPPNPGCPTCHGHPPHGQACPQCQSGHGHNHSLHGLHGDPLDVLHQDYPQHHFTYGYIRPKNLQYPPPQVPGGAIVYPYYTHKGPSDFFRE